MGGQCHTLANLPPGMTQQPLFRKLDGPQGLFGQVQKILPPVGFDPQTVQPMASCYTNYATQPTLQHTDIKILQSNSICQITQKHISEDHILPVHNHENIKISL